MFKWLIGIGLGLLVLTFIGLVGGLASQQPLLFGLSIFCGSPVSMFFIGGAVFSFVANYQITPKEAEKTRSANGRVKLARSTEIG